MPSSVGSRPRHGHLLQLLQVHPGVDGGRIEVLMAEDIGHLFEGRAARVQTGGEEVAQLVRSSASQTTPLHGSANRATNPPQSDRLAQRQSMTKKQLPA